MWTYLAVSVLRDTAYLSIEGYWSASFSLYQVSGHMLSGRKRIGSVTSCTPTKWSKTPRGCNANTNPKYHDLSHAILRLRFSCKRSDSIVSQTLSDMQYDYHRTDRHDQKVSYILSLDKQLICVPLRDPSTDGPTALGSECRRGRSDIVTLNWTWRPTWRRRVTPTHDWAHMT